jgi:cysteinyl-tRNA synthetase
LNFTFEALDQAEIALKRINAFAGEMKYGNFPEGETEAVGKIVEEAKKNFRTGLSDDLNISKAMTTLFELVKKANILLSEKKIGKGDAHKLGEFLDRVNQVLGIISPTLITAWSEVKTNLTVTHGISPEQLEKTGEPEKRGVGPKGTAATQANAGAEIQVLSREQKEKIERREKARAEKNFAESDRIRAELAAEGILLEDTKDGVRWKSVPVQKKPE